ncbi:hypothetical protein DBZ36_08875 [Alginatibacterium sediminis]|uniref:Outer membrane protein beta-barrel domain-containing protein n=1 Tax=Alginatibacterium sediminis TaxID=2164068 RepID=A0A420ED07_9ALTE|nr:hypothetical protein [Alginatibacterium sediminis]RKF18512.1 hypothetical protein DBZ36_08875 [Alginatibacterium sediminis]
MYFCRVRSLIKLIPIVTAVLSTSPAFAAESSLELSIGENDYFDSQATFNNWYVRGNNRPLVSQLTVDDNSEQLNFNGGYTHPLQENWSVFVEAGVSNRYDDIATDRGFNVSTGLKFAPNKSLSVVGSLNSQQVNELEDSERAFELRSSYRVGQLVNLQASYAIEDTSKLDSPLQQYFQVGLGYRF